MSIAKIVLAGFAVENIIGPGDGMSQSLTRRLRQNGVGSVRWSGRSAPAQASMPPGNQATLA
jgi:hypothetical protein